MEKCLFIVLDGTLIKTLSGKQYSLHSEDWTFFPQTVKAIQKYYGLGYKVCIISNQLHLMNNPLGQRTFDRKMELVLTTLEKDLRMPKGYISHFFAKDRSDSYSILPKPGLIYDYALDFEIDIVNSILLGSSIYDNDIQRMSGIKTYIDKTNLTI